MMRKIIIFPPVRTRRVRPTLPYMPQPGYVPLAQLSCHDAPIFRLLLKIAVSLTAFNVTFSIFVRLRAVNSSSSNQQVQDAFFNFCFRAV